METAATLSAIEIIGLAGSASLLAGWRLYLVVLATGLAMRSGFVPLPEQLDALQVFANPWVIGIAGFGALAEFFADKVAWLDSAWDTVHTLVRPIGGALLALAIVDPGDPAMQVIAFLLGGGGALVAHGGKAGARAAINTSPEPVSNVVASTAEDIATVGALWFVYEYPWAAAGVAAVLLALAIGLILALRNMVRRFFKREPKNVAPRTE
ncbi:DUF4126 domain-containing protein [Aurantiacibacter gangjinensis]|uniref:Membrane protein n=1 Tax=Aurantiacibacter gangjinensis TaxID=502682 RepID=A0A0G9ML41_9SPHN|nr:DUF4126 domain-containing protein [Aurantiacibacter gangjinensis]APE27306.1 putative transmembrane protein [Aurantiacibacter gangjinensis]KLE31410.1 membrane protein [Aurantiacibacter gangjinensis]